MNPMSSSKSQLLMASLGLLALGVLVAIYFLPIWWVSLTAPNYPPEAFPDGVRIHFHMNGVFNGCQKVLKKEIQEEEALDCVHEMDTINHYVGMYPIAAGGVVERAFSPFLMTLLGVMLVGFLIPAPRWRMGVMTLGFTFIAGWMGLTYYSADGLNYHNQGYLAAMVTALDQGAAEQPQEDLSPGQALIARLKAEMAKSEAKDGTAKSRDGVRHADKSQLIANLRATFERDQERRPPAERETWTGSGAQLLKWHYGKTLGRYFNNPEEIRPMVATMGAAAHLVFGGLLGVMALLVWGARRNGGLWYWLLVLVPMALPVFFILDYSAWLWWYGHNLNDMGAFTVKAFMPTVFGDGKVAQFATHSYPYQGFFMMLVLSALLAAVALLRRKAWSNP